MRLLARRHPGAPDVLGIDRMLRNVETGRFERSLSALTGVGALVTRAADRLIAGAPDTTS